MDVSPALISQAYPTLSISSPGFTPEELILISEIVQEISSCWQLPAQYKQSFVILIGGFQGSGKSSVLHLLQSELSLLTISNDEIRFKLIEKLGSNREIVKHSKAIFQQLFAKALATGYPIAIDANAHASRIKEIEFLLKNSSQESYQLVKVYLKTSPQVLLARVRERPSTPGFYQGSESDLKASLDQVSIEESCYDLVLNTEILKLDQEAVQIKEILKKRALV